MLSVKWTTFFPKGIMSVFLKYCIIRFPGVTLQYILLFHRFLHLIFPTPGHSKNSFPSLNSRHGFGRYVAQSLMHVPRWATRRTCSTLAARVPTPQRILRQSCDVRRRVSPVSITRIKFLRRSSFVLRL